MNPGAAMYPLPPFYMVAAPHRPPPFYYAVPVPPPFAVTARPVWAWNLDSEFAMLRSFAGDARYVAINVHYPGLVHLAGQDHNLLTAEQRYALVKANVDDLKPLQVGVAICDHRGQQVAWEFNLRDFDPLADPRDENSLAYLAGRGLDVDALRQHGIGTDRFAEMFLGSGLIARRGRGLSWITYTGVYHVAYLLKIVACGVALPHDVAGFIGFARRYLGEEVYDVARMAADCQAMPVGLERVAAHLGFAPPLGTPQLAAAAGVRALQVFRTLKYGVFGGNVERYRGLLQGLQF